MAQESKPQHLEDESKNALGQAIKLKEEEELTAAAIEREQGDKSVILEQMKAKMASLKKNFQASKLKVESKAAMEARDSSNSGPRPLSTWRRPRCPRPWRPAKLSLLEELPRGRRRP